MIERRSIPGYWRNETGGVLEPAMRAYIRGDLLTALQIRTIRAYLQQWIDAPHWKGPAIATLRTAADDIETQTDITRWLQMAGRENIDPL